jgi:hypothetical protein
LKDVEAAVPDQIVDERVEVAVCNDADLDAEQDRQIAKEMEELLRDQDDCEIFTAFG